MQVPALPVITLLNCFPLWLTTKPPLAAQVRENSAFETSAAQLSQVLPWNALEGPHFWTSRAAAMLPSALDHPGPLMREKARGWCVRR